MVMTAYTSKVDAEFKKRKMALKQEFRKQLEQDQSIADYATGAMQGHFENAQSMFADGGRVALARATLSVTTVAEHTQRRQARSEAVTCTTGTLQNLVQMLEQQSKVAALVEKNCFAEKCEEKLAMELSACEQIHLDTADKFAQMRKTYVMQCEERRQAFNDDATEAIATQREDAATMHTTIAQGVAELAKQRAQEQEVNKELLTEEIDGLNKRTQRFLMANEDPNAAGFKQHLETLADADSRMRRLESSDHDLQRAQALSEDVAALLERQSEEGGKKRSADGGEEGGGKRRKVSWTCWFMGGA